MDELLTKLTAAAAAARSLAAEAERELAAGRKELHRQALARRADLLASLHGEVAAAIARLPPSLAPSVDRALRAISDEAAEARAIGSVWYMSILLAGAGRGEPDELDGVIAALKGDAG
ncbi:MAG: hypothetical protein AB1568_12575 [Thermodesulfobacteriota bacterium]